MLSSLNRRTLCLKILLAVVIAKNCDFFFPQKGGEGVRSQIRKVPFTHGISIRVPS